MGDVKFITETLAATTVLLQAIMNIKKLVLQPACTNVIILLNNPYFVATYIVKCQQKARNMMPYAYSIQNDLQLKCHYGVNVITTTDKLVWTIKSCPRVALASLDISGKTEWRNYCLS